MKLSRLYSNQPAIFPPIEFRDGVNVVLARVLERKDTTKDSHNLGKTLLIDLLDFCLLKEVKKEFFMKRHPARFAGFVFFLEIALPSGGFATLRRGTDEMSKVGVKRFAERGQDFTKLPDESWDHWRLPLQKATDWLNSALSLRALGTLNYRDAQSFFLRKQKDFTDVFELHKFNQGSDSYWKPVVTHVLGLDAQIIERKYEIDDAIDRSEAKRKEARRDSGLTEADYDRFRGAVEILQNSIASKQSQLDAFDFHAEEMAINRHLSGDIESSVEQLNTEIYNLKVDIEQAQKGLHFDIKFDLEEIRQVFEEAKIAFPDQIHVGYANLLDFNNKILNERKTHLQQRVAELQQKLAAAVTRHEEFSRKRKELLTVLRDAPSLSRYKQLQRTLDEERGQLGGLQEKFRQVTALIEIGTELTKLGKRRVELVEQIGQMTRGGSDRYTAIRLEFAEVVAAVLDHRAEIWIKQNDSGNLEFHADIADPNAGEFTSEGEGTTYRKFLCMAFDLAILAVYSKEPFYRFVYHDGALETLDDRRKIRWLSLVRSYCAKHGLQYILTAIEDDVPRDSEEKKVPFPQAEIVRELHDRDDSGRLFRMPPF
jgi:uncharacterized protein YydD (DUF2326 family)